MKKLFAILIIAISAVGFARAQNLKFGHINSAELLAMMPATKAADSSLKSFGQQLESQLKSMSAEYQGKLQDYQSKEGSMADAVKQSKIKEITDLENRIQDFQESAQQSIQKKKEELYSPIIDRAEKAIKDVAKEKNYSYIFDTSAGIVLFAQDSDNIITEVKQKLALK